jgi:S1-C subfamily serine protease
MRIPALLPTVFIASAAASALAAQESRITRAGPGTVLAPRGLALFSNGPRAIIGVSTTNAATARDTLGVLVSTVRAGSPAEKAGIEEGNRIASINGVSLKLSAIDVGDEAMAGVLSRRLQRELEKLNPGDDVDLQVVADGQTKTMKIKTIAPSDVYETLRRSEDRATLGLNLAVTGSSRDSIGVFVMSVEDNGPAAKAGIEEGSRIASINGVNLSGQRSNDDALGVRMSAVNRLEREIARAKPGDEVDLRVYFNGQYKNLKVKTVSSADLPRRRRAVSIMSGDNFPMPQLIDRMTFDRMPNSIEIGDNVRRALDEVRVAGTMRGFDVFPRFGNRVNW